MQPIDYPQSPHSDHSSSSRLELPKLKGTLAPAEVTLSHPSQEIINDRSPTSPKSFHEAIPRDYFQLHHEMDLKSIDSATNDEHYKCHNDQKSKEARSTLEINKTVESHTEPPSFEYSTIASAFSSTDSLASLVERQNESKINHPSHQIFNSSRRLLLPSRKPSASSVFSIFGASSSNERSRKNSVPLVRSPLSEKRNPFNSLLSTTTNSSSTRKLEPMVSNPHHIHSSPEVKESSHVSLEYDPVSKRKMLNSYEIIKEIGRGEHGKVKLARDLITNDLVAIKIVDKKGKSRLGISALSGASAEDKVRKEIAIMKKCSHPNVVKLKEVMDDANSTKIYLVLEYLEKGEIKWRKSSGQPALALPKILRAFRDVVLGLEYLHYQGIIHRDIKPANLLISADDSVKISDFGVSFAASLQDGETNELELCKSAGTPAFFAPELCQPITPDKVKPKVTHKIDVWALGITLYCLLFGKLPFWGNNEFELFASINNNELEFPDIFPNNYEWAAEEIFQVINLLNKMLDKDPLKRIGLKSIKRHPFVLRNLSVEEAKLFTGEQKSCESKIHVSNEEVKVAVTGIASRIKKGLARALKFAGLGSSSTSSSTSTINKKEPYSHPGFFKTSTAADLRPNINKIRSYSYNLHEPSTKSLSFAEEELGRRNSYNKSPLATTSTVATTTNNSTKQSLHGAVRQHKRVKSSEIADMATSHATVEGDLFLNKYSAFNALSGIMNDDRRRSSVASLSGMSTASETVPTSNGSSLDSGTQLVSLPVNASFASLDSVFFDNYDSARNLSTSFDERTKEYDESNEGEIQVTEKESGSIPANPRDLFHKMNSFSLNKTTEKKVDESVSPTEPPVTPPEDYKGAEPEQDPKSSDNDTSRRKCSAISMKQFRAGSSGVSLTNADLNRMGSICTNVSQYSVPSYLANELNLSRSMTEDTTPDVIVSSESISNRPEPKPDSKPDCKPDSKPDSKPEKFPRRPSLPKRGSTPKYSFFGDSSDDSDSSDESDSLDSSPRIIGRKQSKTSAFSETLVRGGEEEDILTARGGESESESESESEDSEDETNKLTLVLGSRRSSRINSIAVASINRPRSEPFGNTEQVEKQEHSSHHHHSPKIPTGLKTSIGPPIERVSSPLSKNAPKTPYANSNAHLLPNIHVNKDEYVNHYKKDHLMEPVTKTHYFGGASLMNEPLNEKQRSNSITMGLLDQKRTHP